MLANSEWQMPTIRRDRCETGFVVRLTISICENRMPDEMKTKKTRRYGNGTNAAQSMLLETR